MTRGRPPSAKTLVDRQLGRNIKHPILPAEDFIVPNHSGDHTAGTTGTPLNDRDIANKKYVDDNAGTGDVTAAANMTDHTIIRGDGGSKGIQDSGITISDTDDIQLNKVGSNVITATNANGDLRLGAGGGTNDLKINIDGKIDIFEDLTVGGNIIVTGTVDGVDIAARDHARINII